MLSQTIKDATQQSHQKLEKIVILKLKAIRSNSEYAELLMHFYCYFNALEKAIAPYITPQLLPDHANRRNSEYLKRDIEELGSSVNELPLVTLPEIKNTLQALGALYVMEGSIMGGPYIVKMLAKLGVEKGISFFSGYGPETGNMWSSFIAVLNAQATNETAENIAINAANATFSRFSEVFTIPLTP